MKKIRYGTNTKGLEGKDKSFRNFECFLESFFQNTISK